MLKYTPTKYYLGVFLPLLGATLICLFFRSENTFGNIFFEKFFTINIKQNFSVNNIILFNLPAALWIFSTTLLSLDYHLKIGKKITLKTVNLPIFFVIGLEFLQLFNITDGVFDILDICIPLIFWYAAKRLIRINHISPNKKYKGIQFLFYKLAFLLVLFADTLPSLQV